MTSGLNTAGEGTGAGTVMGAGTGKECQSMNGWQPIETMPVGEFVLLCTKEGGLDILKQGSEGVLTNQAGLTSCCYACFNHRYIKRTFTLLHPLPEPLHSVK